MQIVSDPIYDDTDRRLIAALHAVDVPTDLQSRIERSLQVAMQEQELLESSIKVRASEVRRANSPLWNRRTVIAASVAAGLGSLVLGYRQLTQPLTHAQIVESTQNLLDQVERAEWQSLTGVETDAIKRSLQAVAFLRQVSSISLFRVTKLQPPRNVKAATAYDLGDKVVLFDLTIERGVQGVSNFLTELAWSRSDMVAFAMASKQRTLVLAGPASIRRTHILPPQTT